MTVTITLTANGSQVGTFTFGADGCPAKSPTNGWNISTSGGYAFAPGTPVFIEQSADTGWPGGVYAIIYQP